MLAFPPGSYHLMGGVGEGCELTTAEINRCYNEVRMVRGWVMDAPLTSDGVGTAGGMKRTGDSIGDRGGHPGSVDVRDRGWGDE